MPTTLPAGWKPIESAPKDGKEFLARWGRQGGSVEIVNWNKIHGHFASKGRALLGFASNATHWTPMPQFPGTQDDPITVSLDPDPRGVSVGVWQGSRCIYTGAHAVPSAQDDAKEEDCDIPELRSQEEIGFEEWLTRQMPKGTVISNPAWWAPRILSAAMRSVRAKDHLVAAPAAGDARTWQGLTDAERDGYVGELVDYGTDFVAPLYSVVESIEKRLREKNAASQQQEG